MHEITGNINVISGSEKIHSIDNSDSDLEEDKSNCDSEAQDFEGMKNIAELKRSSSNSSSDSGDIFGKMDGESRERGIPATWADPTEISSLFQRIKDGKCKRFKHG